MELGGGTPLTPAAHLMHTNTAEGVTSPCWITALLQHHLGVKESEGARVSARLCCRAQHHADSSAHVLRKRCFGELVWAWAFLMAEPAPPPSQAQPTWCAHLSSYA